VDTWTVCEFNLTKSEGADVVFSSYVVKLYVKYGYVQHL
jgi:hypothetical protein